MKTKLVNRVFFFRFSFVAV